LQQGGLFHDLEPGRLDVILIRRRFQKKSGAGSNTHKSCQRRVSLPRRPLKPCERTHLRHKLPRQFTNLSKV
jgi:hypothetical protein